MTERIGSDRIDMSMQGKVVVVTGSNVGIGLETAVGVATQGATTVLACRNRAKAEAAAHEVTQRTWNDDVHVVPLDLADLASARAAAEEILSRWDRLDVLVNNAGGTWSARQETAQGFEYTFGVNHLGHFYLTNLLLPRLRACGPARIVNLTSVGHHAARRGMRFEDLQSEGRYEAMEAYCRSKLANVLFTRELARRAPELRANCFHPGVVRTGFAQGEDGVWKVVAKLGAPFFRPPERGARSLVWLALSDDAAALTGEYIVDEKIVPPSAQALDDTLARRLWERSAQLVGLPFDARG
jgi:retinol dehydrogenase 12